MLEANTAQVNLVPKVVDPPHMGFLLLAAGQGSKENVTAIKKSQANVGRCQLEPPLFFVFLCVCSGEVGAVNHKQLAAHTNGGNVGGVEGSRPQ